MMSKLTTWLITVSVVASVFGTQAVAEARRDAGSGQASKKAQYMIRQLHKEKQELQAQLAALQGKFDTLTKEHDKLKSDFDKSSAKNDKLVDRVKGDIEKYNGLAEKYREAITILRKANMDNQYMVKAVQEREDWIAQCEDRNNQMFDANSDLLQKYADVASSKSDPVFGHGKVRVENEMQDYQFKLEDLQVTKFKSSVETKKHIHTPEDQVSEAEEVVSEEKTSVN
jgi:chromosome segregation ATPase